MTGRYQDRFGFTTNPTIDPTNDIAGLPLDEKTIAEVFTQRGLQKCYCGKMAFGYTSKFPSS